MNADWIEVRVSCTRQASQSVEQWLFEAEALSVTLSDSVADERLEHAVLEPAPGEVRLWEAVSVVGLFGQEHAEEQVHAALLQAAKQCDLELPAYQLERLHDQVWERSWMENFKPMRFGPRLWICPTHCSAVESEAIILQLDPGLAFGTGTHATTAQCLQWMGNQTEQALQPLAGKRVIDYGCGSGVLAIAALLLGAEHAWAVDIDEQALQATKDNAALNNVATRLSIGLPDSLDGVKAELLLANILFQPLMALADTLSQSVVKGGSLVMSGILTEQMEPLRMRYNPDFMFAASRAVDGWALMSATRR